VHHFGHVDGRARLSCQESGVQGDVLDVAARDLQPRQFATKAFREQDKMSFRPLPFSIDDIPPMTFFYVSRDLAAAPFSMIPVVTTQPDLQLFQFNVAPNVAPSVARKTLMGNHL
jgi:hypothetical protein